MAESLKSILDNYTALQELWDAALETALDAEVRSIVRWLKAKFQVNVDTADFLHIFVVA